MTKLQTSLRKYFRHFTGSSTPDKSHKEKGQTEPGPTATNTTNPPEPATQPKSPPQQPKYEPNSGKTAHAPTKKAHASARPPEWRRDEDLTTASRMSWEDEIRIHRTIDIHIAEATEFLRRHCFADVDVVGIVIWTRRGCDAATRYVSRCHLASTKRDRAKQVERACYDVEAAIQSACALVGRNLIVHVSHAVGKTVNKSVETSLPSSTVCSATKRYRFQYISQSRMYSVVYSTVQQVLREHFGRAPSIDIPE